MIYLVELKYQKRSSDPIGAIADSFLTNSYHLAEIIEKSNCRTCEDVEEAVDAEMKKQHWNTTQVQFEQHMKEEEEEEEEEEDTLIIDWQAGMFEKGTMRCETCGGPQRMGSRSRVLQPTV